jgi:Family of unknown function (DUF5317)
MIIPLLGLLALLSPLLAGGRLRRFGDIRITAPYVLPVALVAQVVVLEVIPEANHTALSAVHVATYAAAGWFVWVNRAIPGLWIIALGAASNGITIALNGGTLPASRSALETAGIHLKPGEFLNSGVLPHPHLGFLGDVFAIPEGFPLANVFSIGDVLIVVGVAWAAHRICGSRIVPAWRPQLKQDSVTPLHNPTPAAGVVPLDGTV